MPQQLEARFSSLSATDPSVHLLTLNALHFRRAPAGQRQKTMDHLGYCFQISDEPFVPLDPGLHFGRWTSSQIGRSVLGTHRRATVKNKDEDLL